MSHLATQRLKFRRWVAVILWAALIFVLSNISQDKTTTGFLEFFFRKSAHIFEYFVLSILIYRAGLISWVGWDVQKIGWLAFAISLLYAVTDEIHQHFVPGRYARARDVFLDGLGAFLGCLMYYRVFLNKESSLKSFQERTHATK